MSGASLALEPSVYTDIGGLAELKARARSREPGARQAAAEQVEAMFMQLLLRSMRQASGRDPLFGSEQMRFYRDLFDRQIALELASAGGLGMAEVLARQLDPERAREPQSRPLETARRASRPLAPASRPILAPPLGPTPIPAPVALGGSDSVPPDGRRFIAQVLPHARRAARALGADPLALVAQAALESGWGRHVIRTPDGASSHNLFGVKAGPGWQGPRVLKSTLEYRDGAIVRVREPFRVYRSIAESFEDYTRLVQGDPRYAAARRADGPQAYIHALAEAGYATDPAYGEKVLGVLERIKAAGPI